MTVNYDAHVRDRYVYFAAFKSGPEVDRVIKMLAEQFESGEIATAYRTLVGADALDPEVWRRPCWRSYFAAGTIDLDLPLLDEEGRPNQNGYTARCTREVFVRRQDLDRFVATLSRPSVSLASPGLVLEAQPPAQPHSGVATARASPKQICRNRHSLSRKPVGRGYSLYRRG
jgi:hypothetical protein